MSLPGQRRAEELERPAQDFNRLSNVFINDFAFLLCLPLFFRQAEGLASISGEERGDANKEARRSPQQRGSGFGISANRRLCLRP